jgi:transcriptional regulator with XRE-family HTH domain
MNKNWIQSIRASLQISQADMATHLGLSIDMIKSVESERRKLPLECMAPALAIFQGVKTSLAHGPVSDTVSQNNDHLRKITRLNNRYRRRLEDAADELEKMKKRHKIACLRFEVYQGLAKTLATSSAANDVARLQWINTCMRQTSRCIKDNNAQAQGILSAKIEGMRAVKQALEKMLAEGL